MKQQTKYYITEQQLEDIRHYKRMFDLNAERIKHLCSSEKDDIVYGFEFGQIHAHLRDCYIKMMELENQIRSQTDGTTSLNTQNE